MHNPTTRHIIRRATRLAALAVAVIVARRLAGPWPTAIVLAASVFAWGLRAWCRWETRTRKVPTRDVATIRQDAVPVGHVVFARALAVVAAAYLEECEREARP
jgi:hypothetical protein